MKNEDTNSYNGWLVSDSLIKRSFAVMGHYIVAYLIIIVPIMILILLLSALAR